MYRGVQVRLWYLYVVVYQVHPWCKAAGKSEFDLREMFSGQPDVMSSLSALWTSSTEGEIFTL